MDDEDVFKQPYVQDFPIGRDEGTAAIVGTPYPFDDDADAWLRWLMWESFVRQAQSEGLELVEFYDRGELDPRALGPMNEDFRAALTRAGRRIEDFAWRRFEGVAQRAPVSYWLEAEAVHYAGQDALAQAELEEDLPNA